MAISKLFVLTCLEISKPLDLVFAFDTSNDVSDTTITEFKQYLRSVLNAYDISSEKVRISIVLYGSRSNVVVDLKDGNNMQYLLNIINTMKRQGMLFIRVRNNDEKA